MKKIFILLPILTLLPLGACSKTSKTKVVGKDDYYVIDVGNKAKPASVLFLSQNGDQLHFDHTYSDEYFSNEFPAKLNLNLAKTSFALAMAASNPDASGYLGSVGFKDVKSQVVANKASEEDTVNVMLGHKTINNREMVAVAVRGYDYSTEWSSNMTIGLEGDHEGFYNAAYNVIYELKEYLDTYSLNENLSFWFAGYSRGGATMNLVSKYLVLDAQAHIEREFDTNHVYTYTFEAPKCALADTAHDYSFIHNLYNANDFIAMNFPFDFTLMGNMHEYTHLATSKGDAIVNGRKIDPDYDIPVYVNKTVSLFPAGIVDDSSSTMTEEEFYSTLFDMLYRDLSEVDPEEAEGLVDVHTRENYVNNIQKSLKYILALAFTLTSEQTSALGTYAKDHAMDLIGAVGDKTGEELYNALVLAFEASSIEYDETELREVCAQLAPYLYTVMLYDNTNGMMKYLPTLAGNFSLIYTNHYMTTVVAYLITVPLE